MKNIITILSLLMTVLSMNANQLKLTTTGTPSSVRLAKLGVIFTHPATDVIIYDTDDPSNGLYIREEFEQAIAEIQAALDAGDITLKDEAGDTVTVVADNAVDAGIHGTYTKVYAGSATVADDTEVTITTIIVASGKTPKASVSIDADVACSIYPGDTSVSPPSGHAVYGFKKTTGADEYTFHIIHNDAGTTSRIFETKITEI